MRLNLKPLLATIKQLCMIVTNDILLLTSVKGARLTNFMKEKKNNERKDLQVKNHILDSRDESCVSNLVLV